MPFRLTDFRAADFDALDRVWKGAYPESFHVDPALIRQNSVESALFDWGASCVAYDGEEVVGFLTIKRSAGHLYHERHKEAPGDTAHINAIAFTLPEVGIEMMSLAKRTLADRGVAHLKFGQDQHHFFPGCPEEFKALRSLLMVEGFEEGDNCVDLERDLASYSNPAKPTAGAEYRMLTSSDRKSMDRMFETTFPGRWWFDVTEKLAADEIDHCVFGLLVDGEVQGFAMIQDWTQKRPMNGGMWRASLGKNWGALGAIGVTPAVRGKGMGNALLGAALENLKARGVRQCIIDWTGLVDFYGKHGFEVTRTYTAFTLPFEFSR
jgi:predicted N-acetyltransferase YhbS